MEDLKEFLESIGLGKNEAEIYTSLIGKDAMSVLEISKETKLHRSNIYDALRRLTEKGLVYEIDKPTKLFYARPPKSLKYYLHQKEIEIDAIVKNFESKIVPKKDKEIFKVSKGVFALKEALMSLLEIKKSIDIMGIPGKASDIVGPIINDFHKRRISLGIRMRHIYNTDAEERVKWLNKKKLTEARILSKEFDSQASTLICGDRVSILLWDNGITVIEMNDSEIAKADQHYFDIAWAKAKMPK